MKKFSLLAGAFLASLTALSPNIALAANEYNISYTGGAELGADNLTLNPNLITSLTELISSSSVKNYTYSNSTSWKDGYEQIGDVCKKVKYYKVWETTASPMSYQIISDHYTENVNIKKVSLDGITDLSSDKGIAVIVEETAGGAIASRRPIYSDSACSTAVSDITGLNEVDANGGLVLIETNVTLTDNTSKSNLTTDSLYFGFADIDSAQSYKILNSDSQLTKSNMIVADTTAFQPEDSTLRNMYVSNNNYIYSNFNITETPHHFNIENSKNLVLVKLGNETQSNGLNMVFGFGAPAGSNLSFYAKFLKVYYKSDSNGVISGITTEDTASGRNPRGSSTTPNNNYVLDYWTADVDLTLTDGTTIKTGEKLSDTQLKSAIISQTTTFTAHHKTITAKTPNTGFFTGKTNASLIVGLTLPILLVAGFIAHHIYNRKKHTVGFSK